MKKFEGFKAEYKEENNNRFEPLPVGSYVAQILGVKLEENTDRNGNKYERLIFQVDITEGEYKDYFQKRYEADKNSPFTAKYKGTFYLNVPTGDKSQYDNYKLISFNNTIAAIEYSNKGYTWEWDEKTLKGKAVGIRVREREWTMDGRSGTTTEIGAFCPVDDVRAGKVKPMAARKNKNPQSVIAQFTEVPNEELPF